MNGRDLTQDEQHLLKWLARDVAQYGECHGPTLDALRARGFVVCVGNAPNVETIWPPPSMFHAIELTEDGYKAAGDPYS